MYINKTKDVNGMNTLGKLEKMLMNGEISEEEYKYKKMVYVETILELYIKGIITKEQMQQKLNEQSTMSQEKMFAQSTN